MGAHDTDFVPGREIINKLHDRVLFRVGLRLTKKIVVQNKIQQDSVFKNYGKRAFMIPNIWRIRENRTCKTMVSGSFSLWVANFHKRKRPELFIELARQIPGRKFLMIGGNSDRALYERCQQLAGDIDNLDFLGGLPFKAANDYFTDAALFVCTSEAEGFPNTFLQAWANGVPVISTVDPGGVITENGLGVVVQDLQGLVSATKAVLEDAGLYESMRGNIHAYFALNHDADRAFDRLEEFVLQ